MTWLASLWLCPIVVLKRYCADLCLHAINPCLAEAGGYQPHQRPRTQDYVAQPNRSCSRYYPCGRLRDILFAEGSMSAVVLCCNVVLASQSMIRPPDTHALTPTNQHAIKRHLYSQHGMGCLTTARVVDTTSLVCLVSARAWFTDVPRPARLSPPLVHPSPCSPSLSGPGPGQGGLGPPIDLEKLKRGCDHGMRRTCIALWVSLGR